MIALHTFQFCQKTLSALCALDTFKGYWTALETHTTSLNLLSEFAVHGQKFHKALDQLSAHEITSTHVLAIYRAMIAKDKTANWRNGDHVESVTDADGTLCGYINAISADQITDSLSTLLEWTNGTLANLHIHPLLVIACFHVQFLQIGPFENGNQKMCNILTQIYMFKSEYTYTPYVPIDNIIKTYAHTYYQALKAYQTTAENNEPNWHAWLESFLPILKDQSDVLYDKLKNSGNDLSHLPPLSADIMALFKTHDRLKMKEIITLTNGRRATLKLRIGELLDQAYLKRHGGGRSTWYALS